MMPLAKGNKSTINQIIFYSFLLCCVTYLLIFTMPELGIIYLISTTILNVKFMYLALKLRQNWQDNCMRLFGFSILYLFLLFGIINIEFYI